MMYGKRFALHYTSDAKLDALVMNNQMTANYRAERVLTFAGRQAVLVSGKDVGRYTLDWNIDRLSGRYDLAEVDLNAARHTRSV